MMKIILHMRSGGVFITEIYREGDTISSLGKRMVAGGFAIFEDKLWGKSRQLAINLADVSVIEIIEDA